MGNVCRHLLPLGLGSLQVSSHLVERISQLADFVWGAYHDALGQVSLSHRLRCCGERVQRRDELAREKDGGDQRGHCHEQHSPQQGLVYRIQEPALKVRMAREVPRRHPECTDCVPVHG